MRGCGGRRLRRRTAAERKLCVGCSLGWNSNPPHLTTRAVRGEMRSFVFEAQRSVAPPTPSSSPALLLPLALTATRSMQHQQLPKEVPPPMEFRPVKYWPVQLSPSTVIPSSTPIELYPAVAPPHQPLQQQHPLQPFHPLPFPPPHAQTHQGPPPKPRCAPRLRSRRRRQGHLPA